MNLKKGYLIVLEGIDGCGKTTQSSLLYNRLRANGYSTTSLKEPTKELRDKVTLLYFLRDRIENVDNNISPALEKKEIVILDRYYYSTMAYQGAMGLDIDYIKRINEKIAIIPDLLLLFQLPLEAAMERVHRRSQPSSFENPDYLQKVSNIYDQMEFPYLHRIDASQSIGDIHDQVWSKVMPICI